MAEKPTYEELEQRIASLENESERRKRFEEINFTLFKIANAINVTSNLDELFHSIHHTLSAIIDTTNFFIALYDKIGDSITFPYIVDTVDSSYPAVLEISKVGSLTAEVIRKRKPLLITKNEILKERSTSRFKSPACTPSEIWLGVPLQTQGEIIGVMAVQNYTDPQCYDQTDMQVMTAVADQVAIAIDRKRAEETLRASEQRFRKVLQDIPTLAVQGYTPDGTTQYWNHASEQLYGYSAEEAIGRNLLDLIIPPELRGEVEQAMRRMAETGTAIPASELSLMRKDGSRVPVFSNHTIIETPGQIQELFCIDIDLSEHKRTEAALGQEQQFSQSLLQSLPGIFYLYSYPELRMLLWNKAHETLLGFETWEMQGRHLTEWHLPEAKTAVLSAVETVMESGHNSIEASLLTKDGHSLPFILTGVKFVAQGQQYLMGIGIDILDRKRMEEALLRSEGKLAGYANQMEQFSLSAASMISLKDEKVIFAKISQAIVEFSDFRRVLISLFKDEYPYRELIGYGGVSQELVEKIRNIPLAKSWYDHVFLQGHHLGQFSYYIPHTMKHILNQEATIYGDGPPPEDTDCWHPEDNLFVRMNDENGEFLGVISVDDSKSGQKPSLETIRPLEIYASLITQIIILKREQANRERLEEQLRMAQKMESVGRLAGGVAHDFNNMLGVILGHAELAQDQINSSHPLFGDLQEIRKAAQRSAALTRQLLAFARKQTVTPKVLNLNETLERMLTMLRRLIGEGIELIWLPGQDLWPVKVDPSQIDQILANLCVNARDAIAGLGIITVETANSHLEERNSYDNIDSVSGEFVRITVHDNGCGMEKEILAHIFEPFYTTKDVGKGTGLGLATVYGAIKQNNGFITAASEPGQGTVFTIHLPRHKEKGPPAKNDSKDSVPRGQECILLVEDEATILKMTSTILQRLGYSVLTANTPEEAIRLAGEHAAKIHLLLTDVVMPQMNGRDLAHRLLTSQPGMKCLFMSGYTADVISHHGVLDEGVFFIQKPFSKTELAAKIREALHEKKS